MAIAVRRRRSTGTCTCPSGTTISPSTSRTKPWWYLVPARQASPSTMPGCPTCIPSPSPRSTVPATAPAYLGGDWYDAVLLLDSACAAVIGVVVDHNLESAAGMAQTGHMPRALLPTGAPRAVLSWCQLDRTLQAITDTPPPATRPAPTTSMPCAGASVIFFTDGLVEHPHRPIDTGLRALYAAATAHAPCH
ncbi:hypothetical protein ACWC4C_05750 [Streptomyces olivaceoviridis]